MLYLYYYCYYYYYYHRRYSTQFVIILICTSNILSLAALIIVKIYRILTTFNSVKDNYCVGYCHCLGYRLCPQEYRLFPPNEPRRIK